MLAVALEKCAVLGQKRETYLEVLALRFVLGLEQGGWVLDLLAAELESLDMELDGGAMGLATDLVSMGWALG